MDVACSLLTGNLTVFLTELNNNSLDFRVVVQSIFAIFPSESGLLVSSEWNLWGEGI